MKAYICYSRNDLYVIHPICEKLRRKGLQIGIDEYSLKAGEDFAIALTKSIDSADIVLFFYSKHADNSVWIRREIEYAVSRGKKIVPILLAEFSHDSWCRYFLDKYDSVIRYKGNQSLEDIIVSCTSNDRPKSYSSYCPDSPNPAFANKKRIGCIVFIVLLFIGVITTLYFLNFSYHQNEIEIENFLKQIDEANRREEEAIAESRRHQAELERDLSKTKNQLQSSQSQNKNIIFPNNDSSKKAQQGTIGHLEEENIYLRDIIKKYQKQNNILIMQIADRDKEIVQLIEKKEDTYRTNQYLWVVVVFLVAFLIIGSIRFYFVRKKVKKAESIESTVLLSQKPKELKCFIAGSKALQAERDALRSVISVMYNKWSTKNFRILSYTYEDFEKTVVSGGHQAMYNQFICNKADWSIFVIDGQVGGITLEEFQNAMTAFKEKGKPKILALARSGANDNAEILAIKAAINIEHQYWTDYSDINSLKQTFETTLNWDLINLYM